MKTVQVSRAGAVIGQFEPREVRQGLVAGKFLATDHYWTTGMKGWMPLSHFNEGSTGDITTPGSKPKTGRRLTGWLFWRVSLIPDKMGYAEWTNRFAVALLCTVFLIPICLFLWAEKFEGAAGIRAEQPHVSWRSSTHDNLRSSSPRITVSNTETSPGAPASANRPATTSTKDVWDFERLGARAEAGDASAQFMLGRYYAEASLNLDESFRWHHKAAMQGHEEAQVAVAAAFFLGKGTPKDEIEAYAFWIMAALQNEDARKSLMSMLEHGWLSQEVRKKGIMRSEQLLGQVRASQLLKEPKSNPEAKSSGSGPAK
jgi:hypothetical protein